VSEVRVRPIDAGDAAWARELLAAHLGSDIVAGHGELLRPLELPGLVAELDGEPAGLLTYRIDERGCEIVTIHSAPEGAGAGSALLAAVTEEALAAGCRRLWVMTTNDNLRALRFYQRRGFRLAALRSGAVDEARRTLKPEISEIGDDGIPIRDELDLEMDLAGR
jgi:GNAT superfamily N-acetyltransferase